MSPEGFIPGLGGGLRLDLLDPGTAAMAQRLDVPPGCVASGEGLLARSTRRLWARLEANWTMQGATHGPTILPRLDPMAFGMAIELTPFENRIITEARIEELRDREYFVRQPGQKPPDVQVELQMEASSPQFFLRNVLRAEMGTTLPYVPFRDECWRDPEDHALKLGLDQVLTYSPPDMSYTMTWTRLDSHRAERHAVLFELSWEDEAGLWRHKLQGARMTPPGLGEVKRVKGRFADPGQLLEEINEGRERKHRRLPRQVIEQYFYRRPS